MNLLEETIAVLKDYRKTPADVYWVGSSVSTYKTSWENFAAIANVIYDDGWGSAEVSQALIIVGNTWWLERGEYDGSEWWEYKEMPEAALREHREMVSVLSSYDTEEWGDVTWKK